MISGNPRSALQRAKIGDWLTHHITSEAVQRCHGMPLLEPIPHPSSSIPAEKVPFMDQPRGQPGQPIMQPIVQPGYLPWCYTCQLSRNQGPGYKFMTYRLVMIGSLRFLVPAAGFQPEFWNPELGHLWPHGIP